MLDTAPMRPLARFAARLRADTGAHVPDADPLDGGVTAAVLILLETPGPSIRTTGFVSRDNPTGTARNLRRFAEAASFARGDTLLWNTVPWTIHAPDARNRAPRPAEIRAGLAALPPLLALLPRLRAVVLAGRVAGLAAPVIRTARPDVAILPMPHPSPTIVCTSPAIGARIASALAEAASLARGPDGAPIR